MPAESSKVLLSKNFTAKYGLFSVIFLVDLRITEIKQLFNTIPAKVLWSQFSPRGGDVKLPSPLYLKSD